jgi:hypothetical protein
LPEAGGAAPAAPAPEDWGAALSPAHDALAEALHARPGWRTDRSRATLGWRLSPHAAARYLVVELLDPGGASRGYAVLRALEERALLLDLQASGLQRPRRLASGRVEE